MLLGNEAIAQAVVAAGCQVAAAYPGTPSSEILPAIAETAAVENYLGYRFIEGTALSTKFLDQVRQFELALRAWRGIG